jgi:hypothetical protein
VRPSNWFIAVIACSLARTVFPPGNVFDSRCLIGGSGEQEKQVAKTIQVSDHVLRYVGGVGLVQRHDTPFRSPAYRAGDMQQWPTSRRASRQDELFQRGKPVFKVIDLVLQRLDHGRSTIGSP